MSTHAQHIAVLMGGWSPEREVSLVSGRAIADALHRLGFRVSKIDVDHDIASHLAELKPDICFNALHGVGGEDGVVQGLLDVLQIRYTHSRVLASALAMDKIQAKRIFAATGLPIAADMVVSAAEPPQTHPMPPPYVIKPINQGSSIGVTLVAKDAPPPNMLLAGAWEFAGDAMIEEYIDGREFTCAVLGTQTLDVMEIIPGEGFYNFHTKYTDSAAQHIVPANIASALTDKIKDITRHAHDVLGCRTLSRADFRYTQATDNLVLIEVNTQPGMTPQSLVPELAEAAGFDFDALVRLIVEDAA